MAKHKLVVAFTRQSDADFQVRVSAILTALTGHPRMPEPWPEPVPTLAQLRQEDTAYRELQQAVQRRDFGQVRKRDEARERLVGSLQRVASYVELIANGDVDMLQSTGFEIRREPGRPIALGGNAAAAAARIGPPEGFRVGLGPRSGSMLLDATRQRGAIAYEVQTTRGDPTIEEGWRQALIVQSVRRVVVDNLSPGVTWVRLRAVRPGGQTGPWTTPMSVLVS